MDRYRIDEARSTISAVVRPPMGLPAIAASVGGHLEIDPRAVPTGEHPPARAVEPGQLTGALSICLDDQPAVAVDPAQAAVDGGAELSRGRDGELVLRGQRSSPADAFGVVGPPLINPTLLLSWRLVLDPL
jgi:hypothetical protein